MEHQESAIFPASIIQLREHLDKFKYIPSYSKLYIPDSKWNIKYHLVSNWYSHSLGPVETQLRKAILDDALAPSPATTLGTLGTLGARGARGYQVGYQLWFLHKPSGHLPHLIPSGKLT